MNPLLKHVADSHLKEVSKEDKIELLNLLRRELKKRQKKKGKKK